MDDVFEGGGDEGVLPGVPLHALPVGHEDARLGAPRLDAGHHLGAGRSGPPLANYLRVVLVRDVRSINLRCWTLK